MKIGEKKEKSQVNRPWDEVLQRRQLKMAVVAGALILFSVLLYAVFIHYSSRVHRRFMNLEKIGLAAYGEEQSVRISEELERLGRRVKAAAEFAKDSDFDPSGEEFRRYLSMVNGDSSFPASYFSREEWEEQKDSGMMTPEAEEFNRRIFEGEEGPVISEMAHSEKTGYNFAIGEPVVRNGSVAGVVKCVVNAERLLRQQVRYSASSEAIISCIADQNGTILYCSDERAVPGENICSMLVDEGECPEKLQAFQEALRENENIAMDLTGQDGSSFLINIPMGLHSWNLLSFSNADRIKTMSKRLIGDTIRMGLSLIVLTVLAGVFIYFFMIQEEKRIQQEEERYAALANFSDTVLFEYNNKTDVLEFTPNATRLLGISCRRIEHFSAGQECLVHPDDAEQLVEQLGEFSFNNQTGAMEARFLGQDGCWIWCECRVQSMKERPGVVIGKVSDISDRKRKEITLLSLSSTDRLTGLLNREALRERVECLIGQKKKGFFYMIDVDNFKQVNDTRGHEAGDALLICIAQALRNSFRDTDPVGRIGGDEFAAFMSDTADWENAQKKAELILSKMSHIIDENYTANAADGVRISVSIGISACPGDGLNWQALYRSADEAMYEAKHNGKNGYIVTQKCG